MSYERAGSQKACKRMFKLLGRSEALFPERIDKLMCLERFLGNDLCFGNCQFPGEKSRRGF